MNKKITNEYDQKKGLVTLVKVLSDLLKIPQAWSSWLDQNQKINKGGPGQARMTKI